MLSASNAQPPRLAHSFRKSRCLSVAFSPGAFASTAMAADRQTTRKSTARSPRPFWLGMNLNAPIKSKKAFISALTIPSGVSPEGMLRRFF